MIDKQFDERRSGVESSARVARNLPKGETAAVLDDHANICSAMREYGFALTEHDPDRPWLVLGASIGRSCCRMG
jgi:hypothetical protein